MASDLSLVTGSHFALKTLLVRVFLNRIHTTVLSRSTATEPSVVPTKERMSIFPEIARKKPNGREITRFLSLRTLSLKDHFGRELTWILATDSNSSDT